MYTYVAPAVNIAESLKTIEEAYKMSATSIFTCKILDFDGSEMTKQEMEERIEGKTHIVQVYFPALSEEYAKRFAWFKASRSVLTFTSVSVTGSDGIKYDGIVVDEADVKVLPPRMGKKTLN